MSEEEQNDTTKEVDQCVHRNKGLEHCWHNSSAPLQNGVAVLSPRVCCFCSPAWMRFDILVPHTLSLEEVVALEVQHGHLIHIQQAEAPKKQIAIIGTTPNPRMRG